MDFNENPSMCPAIPPVLVVGTVTRQEAGLSWHALDYVTSWDLLLREVGSDAWYRVEVESLVGVDITANLTDLKPATAYEIKVRAMIAGYYPCSFSNVVNFTTDS